MLVLSRKIAERIRIGDSIVLTVVKIQGSIVRLGIEAPPEVHIARDELLAREGDVSQGVISS
jgi:carbon storage regulator